MSVRCPICKDKLIKDQGCYRCHKGHSFDISKEGYLNLLVKQGQKEYGDTFEMISARSVFLNKDYYLLGYWRVMFLLMNGSNSMGKVTII